MAINQLKVNRRQEAHLQAKKLIESDRFDEAIHILLEALNHFGPHVEMLQELSELFYAQNNVVQYYFYARKVEIEFKKAKTKINSEALARVAHFLGNYLHDRGEIASSIRHYQLSLRRTNQVTQHMKTVSSLLDIYATYKFKEKAKELYVECLSLKKSPDLHREVVAAMIKAEGLLYGFEKSFQSIMALFLAPKNDTDHLRISLIDFLEESVLNGWDITLLRDDIVRVLNRLNAFSLSTYEKVIIQFAMNAEFLLDTEELSYLQKNLTADLVLKLYRMNLMHAKPESERDLAALFDMMLRDFDMDTQMIYHQKYAGRAMSTSQLVGLFHQATEKTFHN